MKAQQWQAAKHPLQAAAALYAGDAGANNPHRLLADVYRHLDDLESERAALQQVVAVDSAALAEHLRLAELAEQAQDWPVVLQHADAALAVHPLRPAAHRQVATAASRLQKTERAIAAYRALIALEPLAPADLHYQLAVLLQKKGELQSARREVLHALEEAPRFREAHRLLLDLVRASSETPPRAPSAPASAESPRAEPPVEPAPGAPAASPSSSP